MSEKRSVEGGVQISVDDAAFLAAIDRVSDGAGSSFLARCRPALEGIREGAVARWPVRTGASRAAFALQNTASATEVRASLTNSARSGWGPYAFKIRYSRWTTADLAARVEEAAGRAKTPEAADRIRVRMRSKLKWRHGAGAPSDEVAGKQPWLLLVRRPLQASRAALVPQLQADINKLAGR